MQTEPQVYRLKVDNSGRIVLPADLRQQNHIAEGDTIVVVKDHNGLHIKTLDQVIAEVQAEFAKFVPRGVLLGDEINAERRSEIERHS
jgi:AbrB family looped-hinge helix DNA binding protein